MEKLEVYLDDIENRIDEVEEEALLAQWKKFADGNYEGEVFRPIRTKKILSSIEWPEININDALEDPEKMLIREFAGVSRTLDSDNGVLMGIRSNYGVGIIPSTLGAKKFVMPYELNTLPNVHHLEGGKEAVKKLLESDINTLEQINKGFGADVFEVGRRIQKIRKKYPKIGKYVRVDHPDCQGPMDLVELLWGSGIFVDFYDVPELIEKTLRTITDYYKYFMDKWFELVPNIDEYHAWFGCLHKGAIVIRDDSAMNLPPEMFERFILPYDRELLDYYNGGAIHYCGRGEHFVPYFDEISKLYAVNISQPHLNDLKIVFNHTVAKGRPLFGLPQEGVEMAQSQSIACNGLVHSNRNT